MRDRELYKHILGLKAPWTVVDVELDVGGEEVRVHVAAENGTPMPCSECGVAAPRYDHRSRRWRHLDTCQFQTILVADVPRVDCPEHGVRQARVPWAEPNSGFTALFETAAIDWLKEASIAAVARRMRPTWDEIDGIMTRAVKRGLGRRKPEALKRMGVDETSFQKRHEYVTVVTNLDTSKVLYVADDRKTESLAGFYRGLTPGQLAAIEVVAMDMHQPFIKATHAFVPDAERKVAFDKFHVAKHLGDAVDLVRRQEHRALTEKGDHSLKGSKFLWLQNPENIDPTIFESTFKILQAMNLKTSRAWAIKETAMGIWTYRLRAWATNAWTKWFTWVARCRLAPMKAAAATIKNHLAGVLNAIVTRATNAVGESINSKIQKVKRLSCGFRNRERFRNAIYFHCGGLDLYPTAIPVTHTKA